MFKLSDEKYPEQFWAELIAYQIGLLLNIRVPPAHAAFDSMTGECGSLSEWFYAPGEKVFYAAGQFFFREIRGFDRDKGTQHNLLTAQNLNRDFMGDEQIYEFWSMLLFDSVIGNTDRHQENWGYLIDSLQNSKSVARRKGEQYSLKLKFAPWFDNGTSLGYQIIERKFDQWDATRLDNFIIKGRHHFRWAPDNLVQVGHLESMEFIGRHNPNVRSLLLKKIRQLDTTRFAEIMDRLVDLPMPNHAKFTRPRADFVIKLTLRRIALITEKLNAHN
ncbi:hypothetical protein CCL11_15115 [Pseudomonas syringae]|nr:hypothetical protein CCL11_15115 [Pseudomonas syringae]